MGIIEVLHLGVGWGLNGMVVVFGNFAVVSAATADSSKAG
jgi:hypothetical protein